MAIDRERGFSGPRILNIFTLKNGSYISCMIQHIFIWFPDQSHPLGPLVECSFLPREFIECNEPLDHKGNTTAKQVNPKMSVFW